MVAVAFMCKNVPTLSLYLKHPSRNVNLYEVMSVRNILYKVSLDLFEENKVIKCSQPDVLYAIIIPSDNWPIQIRDIHHIT